MTNRSSRLRSLCVLVGALLLLAGCSDDQKTAAIASVTVVSDPATIEVGAKATLVATARNGRGEIVPAVNVIWASSDERIATVGAEGVALAHAPGSVTITAKVAESMGRTTLEVVERSVASVEVEPASARVELGATVTLAARAFDRRGEEILDVSFRWSSESPNVSSVSEDGTVSGVRLGSTRIHATADGAVGSATIEVIEPSVASVLIEPDSLDLVVGEQARLQAAALGAGHQTIPGAEIEWGSEDSSVATVDAQGRVTAISVGETAIWGSSSGVRATAAVRVAAVAASVEIAPWAGPLFAGASQQLQAVVRDAAGAELKERAVAWRSDDEGVARISSDGLLTGIAPGRAMVTVSVDGLQDSLDVEVVTEVERIVVAPRKLDLLKGEQLELTAELFDAAGLPILGRAPEWRTSDATVATVDVEGRVTALAGGAAEIIATIDGQEGTASISVKVLRFKKLSVGGPLTCGVAVDDLVYCWGEWPGSASDRSHVPRALSETLAFVDVSVGVTHVCALTADGDAWCQGKVGERGALGDGSSSDSDVPLKVAGGHSFRQLSAGTFHTCGVDAAGDAWCWGLNADGRLGTGAVSPRELLPVPVTGGLTFARVDASRGPVVHTSSTCGVTTSGEAWCWGDGRGGQLGGGVRHVSDVPVAVDTSARFEDVETTSLTHIVDWDETIAVTGHSCGRTEQGELYCWGTNDHGQLGDGTFADSLTPVRLPSQSQFTSLSVGGQSGGAVNGGTTCGTTSSGSILCWGSAQGRGMLGDGVTTLHSAVPVEADADAGFVDVEVGTWHACALDVDGRAFCWGDNSAGQLGAPPDANVGAVPTLVIGQ